MTNFVALTDFAWTLGLLTLGIAAGIYGYVKKQPTGTDLMVELGEQIGGTFPFDDRIESLIVLLDRVCQGADSPAVIVHDAPAAVFDDLLEVFQMFVEAVLRKVRSEI